MRNSVVREVVHLVKGRNLFTGLKQYRACFGSSRGLSSTPINLNKSIKATVVSHDNDYKGFPKASDFKIYQEELPELKDGEFLCEAEFLSVDPYLRVEAAFMSPGQVARIIESKNDKYPVGSHVVGYLGWRTHTIVTDPATAHLLPPMGSFPKSYALGILGMPGMSAYFGLLEYCQPKPGEVVLVNGAAGAVGSVVGQIAKIKGCKVIGYAGSDDKVEWLKELGFDYAFNYKTVDWNKSIKASAPDGVNCYFDNVGGEFTSTVMRRMAKNGRITVCGAISSYNDDPKAPAKVTSFLLPAIFNTVILRGFFIRDFSSRFPEGISQMAKWILEGKIKYKETITEGIENAPRAFMEMLNGKNIGKAIVKVK